MESFNLDLRANQFWPQTDITRILAFTQRAIATIQIWIETEGIRESH